jgi:hypothetical protein
MPVIAEQPLVLLWSQAPKPEFGPGPFVRYWHKADIPLCTAHVRYWG